MNVGFGKKIGNSRGGACRQCTHRLVIGFSALCLLFKIIRFNAFLGDEEVKHDAPHLSSPQIKSQSTPLLPRAHRIDKSNLPHRCGLVFFYHVPSTGGSTINHWLQGYASKKYKTSHIRYLSNWKKGDKFMESAKEGVDRVFISGGILEQHQRLISSEQHGLKAPHITKHGGMKEYVTNFTANDWRIAHCHHSSLHLNVSEHLLAQWRSTVESQGCAFIASVMFRDPLSHALSLYKHVENRYNGRREGWVNHLYNESGTGKWPTQLDYFLYNLFVRNPVSAETEFDAIFWKHLQLFTNFYTNTERSRQAN